MKKSLVILLAIAMISCSTGSTDDAVASCTIGSVDGDLNLYIWAEYIDPELLEEFETTYGVSVNEDFYTSNEEARTKLQSGVNAYDIVIPSDYMISQLIQDDLLLTLNFELLPNFSNIDPDYTYLNYDPENLYTVPYFWGTTGFGVNLDALGVEEVPNTWGLVFDQELRETYGITFTLLDDSREVLGAALKYLGYSLNSVDETEIEEATQLLKETQDAIVAYDSDQFEDLIISGEINAAHGWSGDFFALFYELEDQYEDVYSSFVYLIPEEGGVRWTDAMVIPSGSSSICTAHTFMNFMMDAEVAAQNAEWNAYATANSAAKEFIDEEMLADESIYPSDEVVANLEFIEDLGEVNEIYENKFFEAKSSN
ncbi:MAG: spermidine/putrescine ABC transporter substrate-binding protein [Actinomycetota bacterium]|nr:spermidine/putrescine ABC transporter substrate-binding protein [Actinomycetota bacterium]MDA3009038.1 spermidine/putrescine ABC transporter substrate-binding protein [Actinomycetota bacterium]MDA3037641.1 spermidine/putrescine ABC transporter substrate-binding protein [Actinomycetota bacterium]